MVVARFVEQLRGPGDLVVMVAKEGLSGTSGEALGRRMREIRGALRARGLVPGDRVAFVAANSPGWVALDVAILAEGLVSVPFYPRQDPRELAGFAADCGARLIVAGDAALAEGFQDPPCEVVRFDALVGEEVHGGPVERDPDAPLTIVYTSGTSGVAKGAILTERNAAFMLEKTAESLGAMMGGERVHRVFHYLPCCFLGSRVVLWTCLWRGNPIHFSTRLEDLGAELTLADPHYVLNVPLLLERMRQRIEQGLATRPAPIRRLFARAARAHQDGEAAKWLDRVALKVAQRVVFGAIRKRLGANLRCLICGSAALHPETQRFFELLGINVYQVYGLTETTAIVTMDTPGDARPGTVGRALPGVEMRLGEEDELQVRGPNIFPGYWGREDDTAAAFTADGWFRTGDRAAFDGDRLVLVGRLRNVLALASGHKVSAEVVEQALQAALPDAEHVVVYGGKALVALVSGPALQDGAVERAVSDYNGSVAHYRRIAAWHRLPESLTPESGLLTANGKLRRGAIAERYATTLAS